MAETPARIKKRLDRYDGLKRDRSPWLTHWDDLARALLTRRMGFTSQVTEGDRRTEEMYDATGMRAARGLANSTGQLMRPEGEKLFFIRAEDDALNNIEEVSNWTRLVEERLLKALFIPDARFRQSTGEADLDLVVFGTAVVFIGLSRFKRRLHFNTIDLKDAVIAVNEEGNVDTVFQERKYTLRQAEQKFTREKLSTELRTILESNDQTRLDEKFAFLRIVEPRPNGNKDAVLARNFPFTDDWIEINTTHEISTGGFRTFPYVVPRWDTSSGELYGRSPGMIALSDVETGNAMAETILVAGQKAADSPIFAPNEGSFDAANTFSGGITYYDVDIAKELGGNPFFTLKNDFNLPITRDMQIDVRQQVEAAFFKNVFNLPVRGPEMTATEVLIRKEEFIRELGSTFGRLESDYLAPMIERSFDLLLRAGLFNPVPEILLERDVRFEYVSTIKMIRQQAEAAAVRLWVQELTELVPLDPEVLDIVDFDAVARFSARALDLPTMVVRPLDEVEAKRAERRAVEQDALERAKVGEEMEIAATGSKAAKSMAEALSGGVDGAGAPPGNPDGVVSAE